MQRAYAQPHVPTRRLKNRELNVHRAVCRTLRREFPGLIFRTDGGGLPLSATQAGIYKSLQHGPGFPDLAIYKPSRGYYALFVELKAEDVNVYVTQGKRKGEFMNEHVEAQAAVLTELNKLGYLGRFACGYEAAMKLIRWYLEVPETVELF